MTPVEALSALCRARALTVATAESCTGGLVGAAITAQAGASDFYVGGVVCYANAVKHRILGVPKALLAEKGAVSTEVAAAMARGARRVLKADAAMAITGIAGPGGGTPTKPVGTVYLAVAAGRKVVVRHHVWKGTRAQVRKAACRAALRLLCEILN